MPHIKTITEKDLNNLSKIIKEKSTTILLLYMENCVYCRMFNPVWKIVATKIMSNSHLKKHIQFLEIESDTLSVLNKRDPKLFDYIATTSTDKMIGFPKIMSFVKTPKTTRKYVFNDDRDEKTFTKFVVSKLPKDSKSLIKKQPMRNKARTFDEDELAGSFDKNLIIGNRANNKQASVSSLIDKMFSKYLGI